MTDMTYFIKIVDNNNAADFFIDVTTMTDVRCRISTLKNNYKIYLKTQKYYKEIFRFFALDYSYYVIEKGLYNNLKDARVRRDEIINREKLIKKYKKVIYIGEPFRTPTEPFDEIAP